jgi:hypothetical protein
MLRVFQPVIALALFIGVGFVTRHYYREWLPAAIKNAETASKKESAKWKAVEGNFSNVNFDQPIIAVPKIDIPQNRGKR